MSYARSPRPSLVITVGMRCIRLPPWFETDSWARLRRWVRHRQISAEVCDAAQRLQRHARGREPELGRWVLGPGRAVVVGPEQPSKLGVKIGRPDSKCVCNSQKPFRRNLLA